jgi:hypothetical protein
LVRFYSSDAGAAGGAALDSAWGGAPVEVNVLHSPIGYSGVKTKPRKKVTTFANLPVDLVNMPRDDMAGRAYF